MKNKKYRWEYLAKQRGYNKKRRNSCPMKIERLLYPINPFTETKVVIVYG